MGEPQQPTDVVVLVTSDLVLPLHQITRVIAGVVAGKSLPWPDGEEEAVRLTFGEHGEIARLARGVDWASTTLGAVREWPEAQRVVTRLAMDSSHSVGSASATTPGALQRRGGADRRRQLHRRVRAALRRVVPDLYASRRAGLA